MSLREQIERQGLMLRTVRKINSALVAEQDQLLQDICRTLVDDWGYFNAWIAVFDARGKVAAAVEFGLGKSFEPLRERLMDGAKIRCVQKACESSDILLTKDPLTDCKECPLAIHCQGRGALTVCLKCHGTVYGVLTVSSTVDRLENKEEKNLLYDLANDIATGIYRMKLETRYSRINQELEEERDFAKNLVDIAQVIVVVLDKKGRIIQFNRYLEELFGYTIEELRGKLWFPGFNPENPMEADDPCILPFDEESLKGGMVYPLVTKSGATRYIEWYNRGIKENDGELLGYLYVGHDVTERLNTENLLKESEKNFRHIVENALMGISIIQGGKIVYRNPEQIRLLGSAPMLFGQEGLRSIFPDDVGRVKAFYKRLSSDSDVMESVDFRFYPQGKMERDVDLRWLHCVGSSFKYKGEDALYISIVDITESKQLEHMMRIEDKMASLGRVAAGLAHEIRNPLSGINIYLETLERIQSLEPGSEKTLEILAQLKRASAKIASVVQKTMDFSKPGEPRFVIADLNQAIKEAISLSSVTLRKSDIKLEVDLDENLPRCRADLDMITQVLMNLITNAADAMESLQQEKVLSIGSCVNGTNVIIKIADSGPGIPRHLKEKIFEPFFSGKHDGTGIGLSLSHRIVVDHGGTLAVFDAVTGGAEFRLTIPKLSDERRT